MTTFKTNSRVGPDGRLLVDLPLELANTDVQVTIEPASRTNGVAVPLAPQTRDDWRTFAETTAGSMPDFPDIERPGPDSYEKRDLDW